MLMQSHDGFIYLLPAIPDEWSNGSVKGLVARGGFEIDMEWAKGKVTKLVIKSRNGGNCRLRSANKLSCSGLTTAKGLNSNEAYSLTQVAEPLINEDGQKLLKKINLKKTYLYDLTTEAGKEYVVIGK
jgi:alpha-L-fucosidase 2